jgi:hypothetical protein
VPEDYSSRNPLVIDLFSNVPELQYLKKCIAEEHISTVKLS